ncbi:MAG: hypothetical protein ACKO25_13205 [Cyanobium sp.]
MGLLAGLFSLGPGLPASARRTPLQGGQPRYPGDAIPLQVGIHVKNLYNLQLESQTFSADGWYWLEWDQGLDALIREAGISPQRMVEFANQVETWDSDIEPETPEPLPDGKGGR